MAGDPAVAFSRAVQAGDWAAAEAALDALLRADPGNPAQHQTPVVVQRRQGRTADALAAYDGALARAPDHANATFERASCLLDLGRLAEAEVGFSVYLDREAADADARLNRARIRLRLGRPEDALGDLADLGVANPAVRLARAEALRDLRRLDEAEALLAAVPDDSPEVRAAALKVATQGATGRVRLLP